MAFLFGKIWQGLQAIAGLFVPLARGSVNLLLTWPAWLRWAVWSVLLLALLAGLWYLNHWLDLEPRLRTPVPFLRAVWLPLLFLLGYALVLLGQHLWHILGPEREVSPYPDLDLAWAAVDSALDQAGINLKQVPIFLVLGKPANGEDHLFPTSGATATTRLTPRGGPIDVFASTEAVYVCCSGASLMGSYADRLLAPPPDAVEDIEDEEPEPEAAEVQPIVELLLAGVMPEDAEVSGSAPPVVAPAVQPDALLQKADQAAGERRQNTPGSILLRDLTGLERDTGRLQHLCRLVIRGRRPYCPINGLLLLVPWKATASDVESGQAAVIVQYDLASVRVVLQVDCPLFVALADVEEARGCAEFVTSLPTEKRQLPLGQPYPLVPVLPPDEIPNSITLSINWLATALVPMVTYAMFRVESSALPVSQATQANSRLFFFHMDLHDRLPRLARIVRHAVNFADVGGLPEGRAFLLGGTYLVATGTSPNLQAFAGGVLRRLIDNQNAVHWTTEAKLEERRYRWWTTVLIATAVVVFIISGVLVWHLFATG